MDIKKMIGYLDQDQNGTFTNTLPLKTDRKTHSFAITTDKTHKSAEVKVNIASSTRK